MFLTSSRPYLYLVERRDMSTVVTAEHRQTTYNKKQDSTHETQPG